MPTIPVRPAVFALALSAAFAAPAAVPPDCATPLAPREAATGLPGLLLQPDGTRITRADWPCRRQTLRATAEAHVYGPRGPDPERVSARIEGDRIHVEVSHDGREAGFGATLRLPEGPGPHPVLIVIGGVAGVDDALLAAEGIARIDFVPTPVGAETGQSRDRRGAFFELYGEPVQATGSLMAWAWGVSRLIDAIEQAGQGLLRPDAVAVAGCSRYGKGALAAGAFDERIALTIPIESGSGGVPLWRGVVGGGAQPPHSAFGEQPWLADAFAAFANDVERLPIDQHAVLALVAPRGLLVLDNPHVDWLGASAGHAAVQAVAGVYAMLGVEGNLGYHGDVVEPRHCAWRVEWDVPARDAIRRHLHGAEADDLPVVAAGADATAQVSRGER
ncbi:glucuronyl esterase domain-containing protein [Luteimonas sp. A611]